jgi:hypothetical protein
LRAAGETETTQENIQDWLELDGDTGFQLVAEEETVAVIFFIYLFSSALPTLINCPFMFSMLFVFYDSLLLH